VRLHYTIPLISPETARHATWSGLCPALVMFVLSTPVSAPQVHSEFDEPARVDFKSNPPGAEIVIDDLVVGSTPSALQVDPGRHRIQLRMRGYNSWTRLMVAQPGSFPTIRATLTRSVTSAGPTAPPSATTPIGAATSPGIAPGQSAAMAANLELIKVECFSDPSAADVLIDGEFYGNTPSLLRVPVGKHQLELQLSGYKTYALPLILQMGSGIRTIRAPLEQKE